MSNESLVTWIVVGLFAGWLASVAVGGGWGLIGDIILGVVGSFVGSLIFRELRWHAPFGGLAGVIFVAFVGAAVLILALRGVRMLTLRRR